MPAITAISLEIWNHLSRVPRKSEKKKRPAHNMPCITHHVTFLSDHNYYWEPNQILNKNDIFIIESTLLLLLPEKYFFETFYNGIK